MKNFSAITYPSKVIGWLYANANQLLFLVRFPRYNIKCGSSIFLKKVEAFRTRLPMTYKENSFPNVNFKLIFKLDKASLGANQRILNVAEISLPHWRF